MPMVKAPFNGQLNANEIFTSIFNMIISQEVFSNNVSDVGGLVEKFRVDGSMYGDTKLYYATDALESKPWGKDAEASNLLQLHRPKDPKCQAIVIDQFRQISLTVDNYLTKRAWGDEYAFGQFTSVMLGWMGETKKIYDFTLINAYVGATVAGSAKKATVNIDITTVTSGLTGLEAARMEGLNIAEAMANLFVELTKDVSRDFNDYGYIRKYSLSDLLVVWNSKYINKIRNIDLPTVFHKDGLIDKFGEEVLPERYFGTTITSANISTYSASTPAAGKPINSSTGAYTPGSNNANGTIRSLIEKTYVISNTEYHVFPGDEIQAGAIIGTGSGANFAPGEIYIEESTIICKVMHNKSIPFMSAFTVATEFWNGKSLTENHYLTWGYSQPDYLKNYPMIAVKKV